MEFTQFWLHCCSEEDLLVVTDSSHWVAVVRLVLRLGACVTFPLVPFVLLLRFLSTQTRKPSAHQRWVCYMFHRVRRVYRTLNTVLVVGNSNEGAIHHKTSGHVHFRLNIDPSS